MVFNEKKIICFAPSMNILFEEAEPRRTSSDTLLCCSLLRLQSERRESMRVHQLVSAAGRQGVSAAAAVCVKSTGREATVSH